MAQMKEQVKATEKELSEMEKAISQMQSSKLWLSKDAQGTQDLNSIKKTQSETKDTLIEINNNLQGNNSRVDEAENQINDLEHKEEKTKQSK